MRKIITPAVFAALCIFLILNPVLLTAQTGNNESGDASSDPSLVAVGSLSASNLYLSYLVLGTVADGYVNGSYDLETTKSIARETIFLNGNSRDALQDLLDSQVIAEEEARVVTDMIESYGILDNMAGALLNFIEDEGDNGSAYQMFRKEAWGRISALLGLED